MFRKVIIIAAVIAVCASETPLNSNSSEEAVSSQSYTRHDVPLSYKVIAAHPKYRNTNHEVKKNYVTPAPISYITPVAVKPDAYYSTQEYSPSSQGSSKPIHFTISSNLKNLENSHYQVNQPDQHQKPSNQPQTPWLGPQSQPKSPSNQNSNSEYRPTFGAAYVSGTQNSQYQTSPVPKYPSNVAYTTQAPQSFGYYSSQGFYTKLSGNPTGKKEQLELTQAYFLPKNQQLANDVQKNYEQIPDGKNMQYQIVKQPSTQYQDSYLHQETPVSYPLQGVNIPQQYQPVHPPQVVMYQVSLPTQGQPQSVDHEAPSNAHAQESYIPSNQLITHYNNPYNGYQGQNPPVIVMASSSSFSKPSSGLGSQPIYVPASAQDYTNLSPANIASQYSIPKFSVNLPQLPNILKPFQYVHPSFTLRAEQQDSPRIPQATKLYVVSSSLDGQHSHKK